MKLTFNQLLRGDEKIVASSGEPISDLKCFWSWAYSNVLGNTERGVLAEYIVACALGIQNIPRVEWDKYDLITPSGISVEVKSAAYIQSWKQKNFSRIAFSIRETTFWNEVTHGYSLDKKRQSDVYVFCLLNHKNIETINPLDMSQWDFFVMSTNELNKHFSNQKSVSLNVLLKNNIVRCDFEHLNSVILHEAQK